MSDDFLDDILDEDKEPKLDLPELKDLYDMDNIGDLSKALYDIRAKEDEINALKSDIYQRREVAEKLIIEKLEEQNIDSIKTDVGTISKKVKLYPRVTDMDALRDWVVQTGRLDILTKHVSRGVFAEIFEDTGAYPDGMDAYDKATITFRRSK
jgi:hypothetical protein